MGRSRNKIIVTVLLAVFVLLAMAAPALATNGERFTLPRNEYAPPAPDPMDGTHMLGDKDKAVRKLAAKIGVENLIAQYASPSVEAVTIGKAFDVVVSDMYTAEEYTEWFVPILVNTDDPENSHGIICVTKEAYDSFDGTYYHFDNPSGSWDHDEDLISQADLEYLLEQFDYTIWPTMADTFGTPLPRGDEGQKVWILIHNIRDAAWNGVDADTYIAGYFSSSEDTFAEKNMMHIDTYDWANRTRADSARPFLYEGVFAHEYQHLLHFDMDPAEESWVDEGMADLAMYLCGFAEDNSHVVYYLVYHPYTALTFFGGGLENYGACYLFQLYMYEKYGGADFTKALFEAADDEGEKLHGIPGVQATLDDYAGLAFDTVFDRWTIANYVDDPTPGSWYGYDNLEIGTADTWGYTIEYALQRFYYPSHRLSLPLALYASAFPGAAPQPYTAQYFTFNNQKSIKASFDGEDKAGTAAYSGTQHWASGQGTWAWKSFFKAFAIPNGGATLSFQTSYDIEQDWDYGYVEVFDQTTGDWTTLAGVDDAGNLVTTATLPQKQDNPNVPAEREPTYYFNSGEWNGFTGNSGGWVHVNMDLSQFAEHDITIYFRSWQDGAFTLQGMYVDDVAIDFATGTDYFCDFESDADGWTSPAAFNGYPDTGAWTLGTGLIPNDWQATLVETQWDTTTRYPNGVDPNSRNFLFFKFLRAIPATITDADAQTGIVKATASIAQQSKLNWVFILSNRADHIVGSDCYIKFTK